jgi:hypothetical protein
LVADCEAVGGERGHAAAYSALMYCARSAGARSTQRRTNYSGSSKLTRESREPNEIEDNNAKLQMRTHTYWFHFYFNGEHVQQSTKQGNPKVARQIEAAHRTRLAKGEVGIVEKKALATVVRRIMREPSKTSTLRKARARPDGLNGHEKAQRERIAASVIGSLDSF